MKEDSLLSSEELITLSKKNQFKAGFFILLDWAIIVGTYLLVEKINNNWLHIFTAIIWATRLHALGVITHDICHHTMFKNRKFELFIGNLLCSLPMLLSVTRYSYHHNRHHQYLQTEKDPDWTGRNKIDGWITPKPKNEIKKILLQDFLGIREKEHLIPFLQWTPLVGFFSDKKDDIRCPLTNIDRFATVIFLSMIGSVIALYSIKPLIVWFGAMAFLKPIMRMRAISEHVPVEMQSNDIKAKLFHSFSINPLLIERLFFPKNIHFHLEHHLFPTIPYYNLKKLHNILIQKKVFQENAYQLDGYFIGRNNALSAISKDNYDFYEKLTIKSA